MSPAFSAASEPTVTIVPRWRSIMPGSTACVSTYTAVRLTASTLSHSLRPTQRIERAWLECPALLTRTSTRPQRSSVHRTKAAAASGSSRSTARAAQRPPAFSIVFATASTGAWRRPQITTWAPSAASRPAVTSPMPLPPPVTIATCPSSTGMLSPLSGPVELPPGRRDLGRQHTRKPPADAAGRRDEAPQRVRGRPAEGRLRGCLGMIDERKAAVAGRRQRLVLVDRRHQAQDPQRLLVTAQRGQRAGAVELGDAHDVDRRPLAGVVGQRALEARQRLLRMATRQQRRAAMVPRARTVVGLAVGRRRFVDRRRPVARTLGGRRRRARERALRVGRAAEALEQLALLPRGLALLRRLASARQQPVERVQRRLDALLTAQRGAAVALEEREGL